MCQEGRKTRIFVHTICFGQFFWTKTVQSKKHYKNRGFSGNCKKKQKWHLFLEKGVFFDMVEKEGFTVFLKNRKFMKNSGLFLNMAKWCFLGLFSLSFNIKRFVFGVSGIASKVLRKLVFFVAHCCSSGFGRFRCFCVSCVCFSFFVLLLFLFCLLCSWLCGWMLLFCFFVVFLLLLFFCLFFWRV